MTHTISILIINLNKQKEHIKHRVFLISFYNFIHEYVLVSKQFSSECFIEMIGTVHLELLWAHTVEHYINVAGCGK